MSRYRIINARVNDNIFAKMEKQKEKLNLSWDEYVVFLYEINIGKKIIKNGRK